MLLIVICMLSCCVNQGTVVMGPPERVRTNGTPDPPVGRARRARRGLCGMCWCIDRKSLCPCQL